MKRLLIFVAIIPVVLIVAAIALPYLVPTSVYTAQIEKAATTALGRDVKLLGDTRLSVFPTLSASIGGAQVANPDGFEGDHMIEAGELKGSVRLWPLLSRRVEISQITLSDATIRLERRSDGEGNWVFGAQPQTNERGSLNTGIDKARLRNTNVYYNDRVSGQSYALTGFNGEARLTAFDAPLQSRGEGKINGQAFDYTLRVETLDKLMAAEAATVKLDLKTDYGDVAYDGSLTLGEIPALAGGFDLSSDTLGKLVSFFAPDLPIRANELQSLRAAGRIDGPATALALDFETLALDATGVNLSYRGGLNLGPQPTTTGTLDLQADRVERLLKAEHPLTATLPVIGKMSLTGDISGDLMAPAFSNLKMTQRSALLRTDYAGAITLAGTPRIDGTLSAAGDSLRDLLGALGTTLPPGDKLQAFSLDATTAGSASDIQLRDARLSLDDLTATGTLGANLAGPRPRLTADLAMPTLDVTPLMGQGAAPGQAPRLNQDWSDEPLALDGLKTVDAVVNIAADEVIIDRIRLNDALLKTRLDGGRLTAIFRRDEDKPGFRAFDGNWSGDVVIDASKRTPTMTVEALADSVAAQSLLGDLTGYRGLSGIGDLHVDLSSSGGSLKALINDLDGNVETDLNNGALKGLNLAKMVRDASSLRTMMASGELSVSNFRNAMSADAETDFTNMLAALSISNGVATISELSLDNPVVGVRGSGTINLGTRALDIRLVPRVDASAQGQGDGLQLNSIPIPVRISGSWAAPQFGIDSSGVQSALAAQARGRIGSEIGDQIGGDLGGVIGGVIGGGSPSTPATTPETPDQPATEDAPAPPPKSLEDELTDRALGAIFGVPPKQKEQDTPPAETPAQPAEDP